MSTEIKQTAAKKAAVRKATFVTEETKQGLVFRPVNKRAHKWAKKLFGRRTKLFKEDIKAIKATKKVKVYAYGPEGKLVFVR